VEAPGFSVAYLKGGRLIALDAVNQPKDYMMARRLVPSSFQANERELSDPDVSLRDLVAAPSPA
jgi:3-phenylpropionate/trans-cinnamate dioxygenase ferredoxin reductase subunit